MSEPRIPTSPRVALEPREETTCSRCGTLCLDYRSPGPICIGCVDEERRAAEAQVARLRGAVDDLAGCVRHYRDMYERHGARALETGRAWDLMRRAEHAARAALAPEGEELRHAVNEHGDCASWCDVCRAEARERDAAPSPWDPRASRKEVES